MKSMLPTSGANPQHSNGRVKLDKRLDTEAKCFKLVSSKGRIARKRKKFIYLNERKAYKDLLFAVMIQLAERKLKEKAQA